MRAIFAARATTAMLVCARLRSARSPAPTAVSALASVGIAYRAPSISSFRRYRLPRFVIPRSRGLPPLVA
jgi:hypothetical protein